MHSVLRILIPYAYTYPGFNVAGDGDYNILNALSCQNWTQHIHLKTD